MHAEPIFIYVHPLSRKITVTQVQCHTRSLSRKITFTQDQCQKRSLSRNIMFTQYHCHTVALSRMITVTQGQCHAISLSRKSLYMFRVRSITLQLSDRDVYSEVVMGLPIRIGVYFPETPVSSHTKDHVHGFHPHQLELINRSYCEKLVSPSLSSK